MDIYSDRVCQKLTQKLVNYHHSQIVHKEQLAESVITNASQLIIPEYIVNVPDIPVKIESATQDLLCEMSVVSKHLQKRSSSLKTPLKSKQVKTASTSTPNIERANFASTSTPNNEQSTSKHRSASTKLKKRETPLETTYSEKKAKQNN